MSQALLDAIAKLKADVQAETTVIESAKTAIAGIPALVAAAAAQALANAGVDDTAAAQALADLDTAVRGETDGLTAALTANVAPSSGSVDPGTGTVSPAPQGATITLAPPTLSDGQVGVSYSQAVTADGGVAPYQFSIASGSLPDGLSLGAGGTIAGIPTTALIATVTIQAHDANNAVGSLGYSLTVAPAAT